MDSIILNTSMHSDDEEEFDSDNNHHLQKENKSTSSLGNQLKEAVSLPDEKICPSFTNYLYFLFAPTLVYCDTYPRYKSNILIIHNFKKKCG